MRNFLKKVLNGIRYFPSGVLLLFISYIIVYYVDGKETYLMELSNLNSVGVLIYEILVAGISFTVFGMVITALKDFEERKDKVLRWKDLIKIVAIIVVIIVIFSIETLIENAHPRKHYFDGEVGMVFSGLVSILLIANAILYIAYKSLECKKMNKALDQKKKEFK